MLCTLGQANEELVVAIIGMVMTVPVVAIIAGTIQNVKKERHREESRREIAAYVAEGSMSADDAAKLLSAGKSAIAEALKQHIFHGPRSGRLSGRVRFGVDRDGA